MAEELSPGQFGSESNTSVVTGTSPQREAITRHVAAVVVDFAAGLIGNVNSQRKAILENVPTPTGDQENINLVIGSAVNAEGIGAVGYAAPEAEVPTQQITTTNNEHVGVVRRGVRSLRTSARSEITALRAVKPGPAIRAGFVEAGTGIRNRAPQRGQITQAVVRRITR